jgi:hypothetical protein
MLDAARSWLPRAMKPLALAALAAGLLLASCSKSGKEAPRPATPPPAAAMPPEADSVTVGLWRFDEKGGNSLSDASPFRLTGTTGPDVRVEFGRYRNARSFVATAQSFAIVPYNPVMESPRGFSIETWLYLRDYSRYELSVIAARWTPTPNEQSWVFGVVGRKIGSVTTPSPGWFDREVLALSSGRLMLSFTPELAAGTQSFMSTTTIPLNRWVHVAATLDGEIVKFYVDGRLDSQAVLVNGIRPSTAPLVMGTVLDTRRLTEFGSDLRQDTSIALLPFYALNGTLDELRLSNVARVRFESADLR